MHGFLQGLYFQNASITIVLSTFVAALGVIIVWTVVSSSIARVQVETDQTDEIQFSAFKQIKRPAENDLGTKAKWAIIGTQDSTGTLLPMLKAAAREGCYSSEVWKELTGRTEQELASQWKSQCAPW